MCDSLIQSTKALTEKLRARLKQSRQSFLRLEQDHEDLKAIHAQCPKERGELDLMKRNKELQDENKVYKRRCEELDAQTGQIQGRISDD